MAEITDWQTTSNVTEAPLSVPVDTPTPLAPESDSATAPESDEKPSEPQQEPKEDAFERDAKARIRRHKAKSQLASPEDVPRINELTRRLRETERLVEELRGKSAEKPSVSLPKPVETPSSGGFSETEPTLEQFADKPDPYAAYLRATAAYDRKKEAFEANLKAEQAKTESLQKQTQEQWAKISSTYQERASKFAAETKDFAERAAKAPGKDTQMPPLLHAALMLDEKGPSRVLYLAEHADLLDELVLLTDGKPITDQTVAAAQRFLHSRMKDATTGSSTSAPLTLAPRPLNPVRTAPTTPPEQLPGDDASLEEHEKVWGHRRRRRA